MKTFIFGAVAALAAALLIALSVVLGGLAPVAAIEEDPPALRWVLHTAYHQAVHRQAKQVEEPPSLLDATLIERGAYNFQAMCSTCHTPPGAKDSVIRQGLNPQPPSLGELASHLKPKEAFWVIKNGVRMTAMPGFGPTHEDEELWALVAFLQQAGELDQHSYQEQVEAAKKRFKAGDGHDHDHGDMNAAATGEPEESEHGHSHDGADHHDSTPKHSGQHEHHSSRFDTPEQAVGALHHALVSGDATLMLRVLADDVLIYESGQAEYSAQEYASHHMPYDMKFMQAMSRKVLESQIQIHGSSALATQRSQLTGNYRNKAKDVLSNQSLWLEKQDEQWRINHIHWSSGDSK